MSLQTRLNSLVQAFATDVKALTANQGSLAALNTTAKGSLVGSINELVGAISALQSAGGAVISDAATDSTHVWSAAKVIQQLNQVKTDIVAGAPAAYDTLVEISTKLSSDDTAIAGLLTAVGNRVSFSDVQTLTSAQQLQACQNIGIGDPDVDLVAIYTTAKA